MAQESKVVPGRFASIANIHWVAGLVVAVVLGGLLSLAVVAVDNEWALVVMLMVINLIVAAAVGFAVRLTSSASSTNTFVAAFVTAALGVHVVISLAGSGFDYFGFSLLSAYDSMPLSAYSVFYGVVAALVATVGRRA